MTTKVTKESLTMRIAYMSGRPMSLNEEYQLEAYRMLLEYLIGDKNLCCCNNDKFKNRTVACSGDNTCPECNGVRWGLQD